ncbi:MAG TPA: hypothetical protein VNV38_09775 [Stellaceae bacterium]|jgi:hypothetical protein|nr:hypothetical protein [Stellaceae bacterium]
MKSKSDDRQAALERENAELRRQLAESLAQQQAVTEVLVAFNVAAPSAGGRLRLVEP